MKNRTSFNNTLWCKKCGDIVKQSTPCQKCIKINSIDPAVFYLDYVNNYLTVQKIAADHGITDEQADKIIKQGRVKHEEQATEYKRLEQIKTRLAYLKKEIEAERISYAEILELTSLSDHIDPSDTLLLQWAGVDENK